MTVDAVEAVLFDLDGTLCEYRRSGETVLETAFERAGVEPCFSAADYRHLIERLDADADRFADLREECFVELARRAGEDPAAGRRVAQEYDAERDQRAVRFLQGAEEAFAAIRDQVPVGLVTNGGPEIQRQKLEGLGIADAFEAVVYAGFDAPAKPAPEPYERALNTIGVPADRVVFVGNSLATDVPGAKRAGIIPVWLRESDASPPPETIVVESMTELPHRLAVIDGP